MKKLKVAVIGSGSTYTPELVNGFLTRMNCLDVDSFYMMDIDEEKNAIVSSLGKRMLEHAGSKARLQLTTSVEEAVEGADYVLGQVRVGKLDARIKDEKIPMKYGMLGQETTGVGGFFKALRTIPVMMNVAKQMERLAPRAWLINFSNPSGILAQALLNHTNVNMIGLCNNPINMHRQAKALAPEGAKNFDFEYVGLNHLSWITKILADGIDLMPELMYSEQLRNVGGEHYSDAVLNAVKGIPCGYLNYYYFRSRMLEHLKKQEKTRGEVCKEIEKELLSLYSDPAVVTKPAQLDKRGGALYSEAAVSLIDSIENDRRDYHVINTLNKGAFSFMAADDAVEVKCCVGRDGVTPVKLENFDNGHIMGMMQAVKAYERLAVKAGLTGCRDTALAAMMNHPLIGDYDIALPMMNEMLEAHKAFLPQFFKA